MSRPDYIDPLALGRKGFWCAEGDHFCKGRTCIIHDQPTTEAGGAA